jgi:hypothetical protein
LGDGGAYFLGFQIGLFSIANAHKGTVFAALAAPLFVLALPIVDACLAILRRGLRGLPIFRPDRKHLHHRLLGMGLSRLRVVLSLYALTLVFLLMGLVAFWSQGELVPVLLGLAVLLLLFCAGKLSFSREWFAVGRMVGNSLGMRAQIQYALSLTRWLELEGGRHRSVDGLWSDFAFAAQKLGFAAAKLTLEDGQRVWVQPELLGVSPVARYEFQDGRYGVLELGVRRCPLSQPGVQPPCGANRDCALSYRGCLSNPRVFEILSELLAEAWTKAARRWALGQGASLRFDAKLAVPGGSFLGRWFARLPARTALSRAVENASE